MKKLMLIIMILATMLVLTGCGCKHEEVVLNGAVEAGCETAGYTGDKVCVKCDKVAEKGTEIPATGHNPGNPANAQEANCYQEGYTGDIFCMSCGIRMSDGEVLPKTEHTPAETRSNTMEPSCEYDGYTGDVRCSVCSEVLEEGEAIPAVGHTPGEPQDVLEATCTEQGYTGDVYCLNCGSRLERGEWTELAAHTPGEPENAIEPTCLYDGYTGDRHCAVCDALIDGEIVSKAEHNFAEHACAVCGWMEPGLYIDGNLEFTWDELEANQYITVDDTRLTWVLDSMYGDLVIREGITNVGTALAGHQLSSVYVPASVTKLSGAFDSCAVLKTVRLFAREIELGDRSFADCGVLTDVEFVGTATKIGEKCFINCNAMTEFAVPEGVQKIGYAAFKDCKALLTVSVPGTVKSIGGQAFEGCFSLTDVVLSEGLESIEDLAFNATTSLESLTLPSTVTYMGEYVYWGSDYNAALKYADLSKSQITVLERDTFNGCVYLETLLLPDTLENIEPYALEDCFQLKELNLPDSMKKIEWQNFARMYRGEGDIWYYIEGPEDNDGTYDGFQITSIVWPVALTDGQDLANLPNLQTIYYCGSEMQWNLTATKDSFPGVEIIYNYERP